MFLLVSLKLSSSRIEDWNMLVIMTVNFNYYGFQYNSEVDILREPPREKASNHFSNLCNETTTKIHLLYL